jgi:ParB-like chromosome segregation protein Spo0J
MTIDEISDELETLLQLMNSTKERIETINKLKLVLNQYSPFNNEPIDCVLWVKAEELEANDYNPNKLAPPEKRLLYTSLLNDGYTQPIVVSNEDGHYVIVDGFHRSMLGQEKKKLAQRLYGYLPVTQINAKQSQRSNRIASTVRHNRARGKHQISAMSDVVRDLVRLGWNDEKIAKELGMDADEVLRLKQISGLAELFEAHNFSEAWTVE